MSKFRVSVVRTVVTNGWVEVEADDADEAFAIVEGMDGWEIEDDAEWGSCGDTDEYELDGYIETVYEPTVSEGLWT